MRTKVFNNLLECIEENLSAKMKVDDIAKKTVIADAIYINFLLIN